MIYTQSVPTVATEMLTQATGLAVTFAGLVAGAIITIFLQQLLSDELKIKIKYYSNQIKKTLSDDDITYSSKIARRYELNTDADLYELSNELWEEFGVQPTGQNDHFEFSRERGGQDLYVDVRLFYDENMLDLNNAETTSFSDLQTDGGVEYIVDDIRIEVSADIPYNKMKDLLFREYDLLRDIESSIPRNIDAGSYSFTCNSGSPPEVTHALSSMDFNHFRMENPDIELEYAEDELKVRDRDQGEVDEIIDIMYKLVTLYG